MISNGIVEMAALSELLPQHSPSFTSSQAPDSFFVSSFPSYSNCSLILLALEKITYYRKCDTCLNTFKSPNY
ncbi:hypothetical protein HNY73_011243 [Argiope bruennichi]|uniref:Uncharacterized protein n=1 Tax=Argiope bruennichi TaxID=94029 RepID=A0A8T0F9S3_ARGBR|nr:hypothetical protein HNY73_011243 [Argiope bruennichi]